MNAAGSTFPSNASRRDAFTLMEVVFALTILAMLPARFGVAGYIAPIVVMTASYAVFQAANNTAVMNDTRPDQRGVVSGLLGLSRNLGLITGASMMGAVFAFGSAAADIATASPQAVAAGMRLTFTVAAGLIVVALAIAVGSRARPGRPLRSQGMV
jgi:prepilin-type N-terminal cleavage/methylation domain-containing protein